MIPPTKKNRHPKFRWPTGCSRDDWMTDDMVRQMVKLVTREQTHTPHHGLQSQLLLGGRKSFEPVSRQRTHPSELWVYIASRHLTSPARLINCTPVKARSVSRQRFVTGRVV